MKNKPLLISLICGFSLLELMILLVLSSGLFLIIEKTYFMTKLNYLNIEKNNILQNRLRLVTTFLQQKITMSGFIGCGNLSTVNIANHTEEKFDFDHIIEGFSSNNLPENLKKYAIAPNTDVLVIRKADDNKTLVTDLSIKKGSSTLHAQQNPASPYRKILLLSNCRYADLFIADNIGGTLVRSQTPFAYDYTNEGQIQIAQFTSTAFFISKNKTRYGLYYSINNGKKQRLFDDIKDLKISYGLLNGKNKIQEYLSAQEISQQNLWHKINSVILHIAPDNSINPNLSFKTWDVYVKLRQRV